MPVFQLFIGLLLAFFGSMGNSTGARAGAATLLDRRDPTLPGSDHGLTLVNIDDPAITEIAPHPYDPDPDNSGPASTTPPDPDPDNSGPLNTGTGSTGGSTGGGTGDSTGGGTTVIADNGTPITPVTPPAPGPISPPVQTAGTGGDGGAVAHTLLPADGSAITVTAGRVSTLDVANSANVSSVQIMQGPQAGNLTVNPDHSLALVMSDSSYTGPLSFSYQVTYNDGTTSTLTSNVNAVAGPEQAGWGLGNFYNLQADSAGKAIVEYGTNHRAVYVSGDPNALTLQDIAAREGINVNQIDANWLINHPQYGSSQGMALDQQAGSMLWSSITGRGAAPSSDWLMLERGFSYDGLGRLIERGTHGESELHPIYVGAYGSGSKPLVTSQVQIFQNSNDNIVIQDIAFSKGVMALSGNNILMDNVYVTGTDGLNIQNIHGFTLQNSNIIDVIKPAPANGSSWVPHADRASGAFFKNTHDLLLQNNLFDHNGWADGYDYNLSGQNGQPPSMFSQNVYIQYDNTDVTFRDNITMRGASFGANIRSGGFIEDNVFLDNNAALNAFGGNYLNHGYVGNYSLLSDNVITSAGYKTVAQGQGALSQGLTDAGAMTTMVDNIIAHLADPNNPAELASKVFTNQAFQSTGQPAFYNDTVIYNWLGSNNLSEAATRNINTGGLDQNVLDQTTIQQFTAQLLGQQTATITDLADYLRAQASGNLSHVVDSDLIVNFFQQGFGLAAHFRPAATTVRFVPNSLGDGMRWDNRLNWDTQDLPGTHSGDSVDLAGNWVYYGGTSTIQNFDFGSGGKLHVDHGYLDVNGAINVGTNGAELQIDNAGQFWSSGYTDSDLLTVDAAGGRFANTGLFHGHTDMTISDNAQVILATDGATFDLTDGSTMSIVGSNVSVGFDGAGSGPAVMRLGSQSTLDFTAQGGQLGSISEFRSGFYGPNAPSVHSGIDLGSSTLSLDLTGVTSGSSTLINVDQIMGTFSQVAVTGLAGNQDATVVIDYTNDTVTLQMGQAGAGSGAVNITTQGDPNALATDPTAADIWNALTMNQPVLPMDAPGTLSDPGLSTLDPTAHHDPLLMGSP